MHHAFRHEPASQPSATFGADVRADTRGAVLVVGIVLGALLTVALCHLVGVGKAVIWREAAQSAADSAALQHAAWQARGMNLLSAVNIVLALIAGVLVLWRLALSVATAASLLTIAASLLEPKSNGESERLHAGSLLRALAADARIARDASSLLGALSASQTAIATYTPILATRAVALETSERYGVSAGVFSGALLPTTNPSRLDELASCAGLEPSGRSSSESQRSEESVRGVYALSRAARNAPPVTSKLGMPFSLPAQSDDYSLLCASPGAADSRRAERLAERGLGMVPELLTLGFDSARGRTLRALGVDSRAARVLELVRELSGLETARAGALFCAPYGQAQNELGNVAARLARHLQATEREVAAEQGDDAELAAIRSLDEARQLFGELERAWHAEPRDVACGKPAKVWDTAKNGNVHLRSMALVAPAGAATSTRSGVWSHAEMYFDCAGSWEKCEPNALWQLRWTSRLRRVQPFSALLAAPELKSAKDESVTDEAAIRKWLELGARRLAVSSDFAATLPRGFVPGVAGRPVAKTVTFALERALFGKRRGSLADFIAATPGANAEIH